MTDPDVAAVVVRARKSVAPRYGLELSDSWRTKAEYWATRFEEARQSVLDAADLLERLANENRKLNISASDRIGDLLSQVERLAARGEWQLIETAPKDGTRIDLLYPYPRGRTIDCYWDSHLGGAWVWNVPHWDKGELLPENKWGRGCYPNMEPTHWMLALPLPSPPRSAP